MKNKCYKCGSEKDLTFIRKGLITGHGHPVLIKNKYVCEECLKSCLILNISLLFPLLLL